VCPHTYCTVLEIANCLYTLKYEYETSSYRLISVIGEASGYTFVGIGVYSW